MRRSWNQHSNSQKEGLCAAGDDSFQGLPWQPLETSSLVSKSGDMIGIRENHRKSVALDVGNLSMVDNIYSSNPGSPVPDLTNPCSPISEKMDSTSVDGASKKPIAENNIEESSKSELEGDEGRIPLVRARACRKEGPGRA